MNLNKLLILFRSLESREKLLLKIIFVLLPLLLLGTYYLQLSGSIDQNKRNAAVAKTNFEYVGEDFSNKVREVYYDKKSKKMIYGTTTLEERKELEDEGIDLVSIPWANKDN